MIRGNLKKEPVLGLCIQSFSGRFHEDNRKKLRFKPWEFPSTWSDDLWLYDTIHKSLDQGRTSELFDNVMHGDASHFPELSQIVECLETVKNGCQASGDSEIDMKASECSDTSKGSSLTPKVSLGDEFIAPIHKSYQKELSNKGASTLHPSLASFEKILQRMNDLSCGVSEYDSVQQLVDWLQKVRGKDMSFAGVLGDIGIRPCVMGLGSLLIQDININDNTEMKPATSFTKIWRMRNMVR